MDTSNVNAFLSSAIDSAGKRQAERADALVADTRKACKQRDSASAEALAASDSTMGDTLKTLADRHRKLTLSRESTSSKLAAVLGKAASLFDDFRHAEETALGLEQSSVHAARDRLQSLVSAERGLVDTVGEGQHP